MDAERCLTVFFNSSSSFWISAIRLRELESSETEEHTLSCLPDEKRVLSCRATCRDVRIASRGLDIARSHCIWPSSVDKECRSEHRGRDGYRNWVYRGLQGRETFGRNCSGTGTGSAVTRECVYETL